MPNTYVALATQTLGSAAATVTFNSIPQGYTDLVLVMSAKSTGSVFFNDNFFVTFNGDSATNYSRTRLTGNGSTATSARGTNDPYLVLGQLPNATSGNSANDRSANITSIMNYSNTTTFKTVLSRSNAIPSGSTSTNSVEAYVNLWRSTAAITSISITSSAGNLDTGSTFSLYGIAASGAGLAKATGGTISYGGDGYIYHTFTSSGTFTPTSSLTADVLVVAGGGGGGRTIGGGGGAGGLLGFTSQSLTATGYTCTVGAGGAGATTISVPGTNGVDSQFGALTLVKGGGGGGSYSAASVTGGSGGGGGWNGGSGSGASATSGQGFAGGNSFSNDWAAGGGGGAGAVGAAGITTGAGNGGVGSAAYSSWGSITSTGQLVSGIYYYGGGGGGGSNSGAPGSPTAGVGGFGGGAAGLPQASQGVPTAALANTGGGGGGSGGNGNTSNGGTGGSGIIIVRYLG